MPDTPIFIPDGVLASPLDADDVIRVDRSGKTMYTRVEEFASDPAFTAQYAPLAEANDPLIRWRQAFHADPATAKVVVLGDSTSLKTSQATQLFTILDIMTDSLYLDGMDPANILSGGNSGQTAASWYADALAANTNTYSWADLQADAPDLIVMSWGINDVRTSAITTAAELIALLEDIIELIQGTLTSTDILLRMPNSFQTTVVGTDFVTGANSEQVASTILRDAYLHFVGRYPHVDVINMQDELFGSDALVTSSLMSDQIHPSDTGYALTATAIAERIGVPIPLGTKGGTFFGFGRVTASGNGYFDIGRLNSNLLGHPLFGIEPLSWPIVTTDSLVFSDYGLLALTSSTFAASGTNIRVLKTGDWTALNGQYVTLSHNRQRGVGNGRVSLTIDPGSVAAGATLDVTATVTGARVTENAVLIQPPTSILSTGLLWSAMVSANDTITVRLYNPTGSPIDLASSANWRVWLAY